MRFGLPSTLIRWAMKTLLKEDQNKNAYISYSSVDGRKRMKMKVMAVFTLQMDNPSSKSVNIVGKTDG